MTSSKTTVLGIRLDHDRRGWIEAEAARQGMSIRAYFERMIDEARAPKHEPQQPAEPIARESVRRVGSVIHDDSAAEAAGGDWLGGETNWIPERPMDASPSPSPSIADRGLCDDLVSVAAIPCRVLKEALELPRALINAATRPFRRNRSS